MYSKGGVVLLFETLMFTEESVKLDNHGGAGIMVGVHVNAGATDYPSTPSHRHHFSRWRIDNATSVSSSCSCEIVRRRDRDR